MADQSYFEPSAVCRATWLLANDLKRYTKPGGGLLIDSNIFYLVRSISHVGCLTWSFGCCRRTLLGVVAIVVSKGISHQFHEATVGIRRLPFMSQIKD